MYVFECSTDTHPPITTTATTSAVQETTYPTDTSIFSTTAEELTDSTTAEETYPGQGGTTAIASIDDMTTSESTESTTVEETSIWDSTSTSAASGSACGTPYCQ